MQKLHAQGSTEYLVVLGVVLIISLVSVSLLGYFPGTAGQSRESASKIYWQGNAQPFKIIESSTLGPGDRACGQYVGGYQLALENGGVDSATITGVSLNGQDVDFCLKGTVPTGPVKFGGSEMKILELGQPNLQYDEGKDVVLELAIRYNSEHMQNLTQTGKSALVFKASSSSAGCVSTGGASCYSGFECCSPDVCNPATLTCVACKQTGEACNTYAGDSCCGSGYCVQGVCTAQCGNLNEPCVEGSCCSGAPYCVQYPSQCKAGNLGDRCIYGTDCISGYCGGSICTSGISSPCSTNDSCNPAAPYCVNGNCSATCASEGQRCSQTNNPCCSTNPYCVDEICSSVPGTEGQQCSSHSSNCGPEAPTCSRFTDTCTASTCYNSEDCMVPTPYCTGQPLSCTSTCAQPGEKCGNGGDTRSCCGETECRSVSGLWYNVCRPGTTGDACGSGTGSCAAGFYCVNYACAASCGSAGQKCTKSSDCCSAIPYCSGLSFFDMSCSSGSGTPCDSNADCGGSTPYCDMKIGRCSVCISANSKTCTDTSQCCPGFGLGCNTGTGVCS